MTMTGQQRGARVQAMASGARREELDRAVAEARSAYASARPRSRAQAAAATAFLPAGSTRSVLDFEPFPFRVAEASGASLVDVDGHRYTDLLGDYTAGLLGHDPPEIAGAIRSVLDRGWSLGAVADGEHRLAELLCGRFRSIDQIRFTNSGTEANLMAVGLARHVSGRSKVAVAEGAYHGGLLYFGPTGAGVRVPFDYVTVEFNDLDSVARAFESDGDDIACLLLEPMMGAAGCLPAEPGFLEGVRELCDDHGVLLAFDEVMTSRMSIGGAQGRLGVVPDLTTLGKYLGGGLSFGAFGGSAELMAAFDPARGGRLSHGGTFNNNAFTMTAGVAAVEQLVTAVALEGLFERGELLRAGLGEVLARHRLRVTGWGSLLALHPVDEVPRRPADLATADRAVGELVFLGLLERGWYIAPRGFVALSLPVTDVEVDGFVAGLAEVVTDLAARGILTSRSGEFG